MLSENEHPHNYIFEVSRLQLWYDAFDPIRRRPPGEGCRWDATGAYYSDCVPCPARLASGVA